MKQLVEFRGEFADAQSTYLRALKNTGVTLRQFTESESLELENTSYGLKLPPSPPLSLPPSPPPPPPFSPDSRKSIDNQKEEVSQEESMKIDEDECSTPPPPPLHQSSCNFWDPFEPSSSQHQGKSEIVETVVEEENWAETKTEFEEEDQEEVVGNVVASSLSQKPQQQQQQTVELVDDNSSMISWSAKDSADMAAVVRRSKKTLEGIIKELDDYFLRASAGGKDIAVLMDISKGDTSLPLNFKENKSKYWIFSTIYHLFDNLHTVKLSPEKFLSISHL